MRILKAFLLAFVLGSCTLAGVVLVQPVLAQQSQLPFVVSFDGIPPDTESLKYVKDTLSQSVFEIKNKSGACSSFLSKNGINLSAGHCDKAAPATAENKLVQDDGRHDVMLYSLASYVYSGIRRDPLPLALSSIRPRTADVAYSFCATGDAKGFWLFEYVERRGNFDIYVFHFAAPDKAGGCSGAPIAMLRNGELQVVSVFDGWIELPELTLGKAYIYATSMSALY